MTTMIDPDDINRWAALAADLGLPPESEQSRPAPAEAPARTQPKAPEAEREVRAEEPEAPADEGTESGRSSRGRRRRGSTERKQEPAETPSEVPAETEPVSEAPEAEETPAGGERRKRR